LLNALLAIEFASAAGVIILLFFINAPYGRFVRKGWGPTVSARYGWMLMEFPAFLMIAWIVLANLDKAGAFGAFFLIIWEAHYFYRVFVYPFIMTSPKKPFPALLVFFAVCFNSVNGAANGLSLVGMGGFYSANGWSMDARLWIGLTLFIAGFGVHAHSDKVLRILRRQGKGEYLIPKQGMFRLVSNANYLGEMVEWTGFAIATWSLAGLAFASFTIANLLPRAYSNHQWYKKTFADYPVNRKVLVPFLW